jgi:pimeloyl-ACP methyl ester carboxylesterase
MKHGIFGDRKRRSRSMLIEVGLSCAAALSTSTPLQTEYIDLPRDTGRVAVHCLEPQRPTRSGVLFVHGATFPTKLAAGYEFKPGDSWLSFVAARGDLACGLDFLGYGESSRPMAMLVPAQRALPVSRAAEAAEQIALAVAYLRERRGMTSVHVIAHSWGTIPAAAFAASHPTQLQSLTLFGPIVARSAAENPNTDHGAWFALKADDRLEQLYFKTSLPVGMVLLDPAVDRRWADQLAASSHIEEDPPRVLRIPEGPNVDIEQAAAGVYPYDPNHIKVPIFVVYGSYDFVLNDGSAAGFTQRFTGSPLKWRLRIDDGTHVMHLDRSRHSLYESVAAFISATDTRR